MALETGSYIADLTTTNPVGASDVKSQGDDHLRLIKTCIKGSFGAFVGTAGVPKSVTLTEDQINDAALKSATATISAAWDFTTNPQIDGVDLLTGAQTISGTWDFTGDPTIDSIEIGFKTIPQNSQSIDYTAVLTDSGKHIYQTGASKTVTIPANASVAYPIGTALEFIGTDAGGMSIAITTDTMTLAGSTTTGTRTLAQNGVAVAIKTTATTWIISGAGLT